MTGESVKHPAEDELLAFGLGKLDPAEAEKIAEHLDSCRDCSETIVGLEDDTFVSLVRNSLAPSPTEQGDSQPAKVPLSPEATVDVASGLTDGSSELADLPRELCEHARYEILELIGRGGMGDVYTAQHKVMNRVVALKVIKPELVQNETAVGRFQREVQAAARLHHGNIVTAYDAEQAGDLHYLVMEFVDGVNLDEVIHDRGSLPVAEACKYVQQAAEGLHHAHELGMVHRDIKPHNLMVASSGQVKILDFGLANFANEVAADEATDSIEEDRASAIGAIHQLTQMGTMMGTPDYIAPEQARDAHEADIRADIYSLGCTFYTLLAGKAPFAEGSILEKIKAHAEQEAPQLVNFRDDVPSEVEAVLLKMTAKDPAARYQTPAEVAEALKSAARQASQPVTESVAKPRHGGSRSRRTWAAAFSVVLLMVLLPLTYFFGGTVIHFVTNQGVLVVEVNDKNVEVVIRDQDGLVLRDRSTEREFTLKAVEGEIEVYEAGSNLRLFTKKFTLSRGGKEYVRIKALELAESRNRAGGSDDPKQIGDATHPSSSEARAAITEVRRFEGHTGTVKSVAISPDGKFAASASGWPHGDKSLRLWNLATGEEVRQFKGHTDQVMRVAFSWDGRRLVSGSADHTARAWDAATGKQIAVLSDHEGPVQAFAFGPDSNTVWTAPTTSDGKGKIRHWLFEADEVYTNFDRGNGRVIDMAVSPDGQRLITGNDSSVRIWNMRGHLLRTVASPANQVESLAFSHDGRYFAVAAMSGKWIHVHDAVSGAVFRTLVGTEGMRSVAFTLDNRHIVAAGLAGVVHVWDVQTGKEIARSEELTEIIWSVAVSPDGRTVLTGGGSKRVGQGEFERGSDFALRLWQLPESVRPQVTEVCSFEGHDGRGSNGRLAVSPDGTLIATYQSGTVLIWDVGSAKQKYIVRTGEMSIASVVFLDHDPPMIAIGTADVGRRLDSPGSVLIWDLESNKLHRQLSTVGEVHTLDLSPDGRQLAVGALLKENAQTVLWDLETFNTRVIGEDEPVFKVAFSPDGKYLVTATSEEQGTVRLWDAKMGQLVSTLARVMNPGQLLANLEFSPDSRGLAIAGGNHREQYGEVVLLDVPSLKFQRRIGRAEWKVPIEGIAFSPNGRWLALSASDDVHLLDTATTNDVARFKAYRKPGQRNGADLAFSADGRHLFAVSPWMSAKMWRLPAALVREESNTVSLKRFVASDKPLTDEGIVAEEGGWKITSDGQRRVQLFEVRTDGIEDALLIYRAKLKTSDPEIEVSLRIKVLHLAEQLSTDSTTTIARPGTLDWSNIAIPHRLDEGKRAEVVWLGLDIQGSGDVWIKDIELLKERLPARPKDNVTDQAKEGLTREHAKSLIAKAASIPNDEWTKLGTDPGGPKAEHVTGTPLSWLLLTLNPNDLPSDAADVRKDFRILTPTFPKPTELSRVMWTSIGEGYASIIQPSYVTNVTVSSDDVVARGIIEFEAKGLYAGRVEFVARSASGEWQIEEFYLPNFRVTIQLEEDGVWRRIEESGE